MPLAAFLYAILKAKDKQFYKTEFKGFLITLIIGALLVYYLFPFLQIYSSQKIQGLSIMSFDEFDKLAANVGPMITSSELIIYFALFFFAIILFLGAKYKKWRESETSKCQFLFGLIALLAFIMSLGLFVFSYEYQSKFRYVFYAFLMVPIIFACYNVITQKNVKKNAKFVSSDLLKAGIFLIVLLPSLYFNIPNNFQENHWFGSNQLIDGKVLSRVQINKFDWELINWVRENTAEDASFLSVLGLVQDTQLLTQRKSNYINHTRYAEIIKGNIMSYPIGPVCIDGFSFRQLPFTYEKCNSSKTTVADYNYVLVDLYQTLYGTDPKIFKEKLISEGYEIVFDKYMKVILKKPA